MNMDIIDAAGQILRQGGLVAFPTETVYGLGANALDEEAARKTYAAKGRPSDNPLIVHIADLKALYPITKGVPEKAVALAEKFWPGPLTMIFEKSEIVPHGTTGGLDTVAVRMPDDTVTLALIKAAGGYVSGPSANTGRQSNPGGSLGPFGSIELRVLHRIVQEFRGEILIGDHHEMDVHLRVYLYASLLFRRPDVDRLAGFRPSGNRSANIRRSRRHLLQLHAGIGRTKNVETDGRWNV